MAWGWQPLWRTAYVWLRARKPEAENCMGAADRTAEGATADNPFLSDVCASETGRAVYPMEHRGVRVCARTCDTSECVDLLLRTQSL